MLDYILKILILLVIIGPVCIRCCDHIMASLGIYSLELIGQMTVGFLFIPMMFYLKGEQDV